MPEDYYSHGQSFWKRDRVLRYDFLDASAPEVLIPWNIPVPFWRFDRKDKILALGLGADDYLTKPFSIHLLYSKLKALIRRNNSYQQAVKSELILGPFRMDKETMEIYKDGELLNLTSKELMLLKAFIENPNRVYTKEQLYELVWKDHVVDDNTIMVYVKRLRKKIEDNPKEPKYLTTVWGIGYQFKG